MKIKVSELTGAALDWAVAKCEERGGRDNAAIWLRDYRIGFSTRYSTTWSQGGPIIEREGIETAKRAEKWTAMQERIYRAEFGPTPLIAAMRCYVASKLGDEVEVPDELCLTHQTQEEGS